MPASRFDAVVFDIGGVLEHNPRTAWEDPWCDRLGLDRAQLHDRLDRLWTAGSIGTITLEDVHRGVAEALSLDKANVAAFMEEMWIEYVGTPDTEMIAYFTSLGSRFTTGILSNSFVGAREREARYGFERMCQVVVYSHEEGMRKPQPEFYRLVCGRLGVDPRRTVFVDDTDEMLRGAAAVGMTAVKSASGQSTIDQIEAVLTRDERQ